MPRVCLRILLLTRCLGNEASTRNCEKVVFNLQNSRDILRSKKSKRHASVLTVIVIGCRCQSTLL